MIYLFPVVERSDHLMSGVIEKVSECVNTLSSQYFERTAEVKVGQVSDQRPETLIFSAKLVLVFELVHKHAACPNGAGGEE